MELAFDHLRPDSTGFSGRLLAPEGESHRAGLPDWSGIKARFIAAHALRRELALASAAEPAGGSFIAESELVLAASRANALHNEANSSRHVNPTASANSKPLGAIEDYIVGNPDPASEEEYD
jgi:hypothetical protein